MHIYVNANLYICALRVQCIVKNMSDWLETSVVWRRLAAKDLRSAAEAFESSRHIILREQEIREIQQFQNARDPLKKFKALKQRLNHYMLFTATKKIKMSTAEVAALLDQQTSLSRAAREIVCACLTCCVGIDPKVTDSGNGFNVARRKQTNIISFDAPFMPYQVDVHEEQHEPGQLYHHVKFIVHPGATEFKFNARGGTTFLDPSTYNDMFAKIIKAIETCNWAASFGSFKKVAQFVCAHPLLAW